MERQQNNQKAIRNKTKKWLKTSELEAGCGNTGNTSDAEETSAEGSDGSGDSDRNQDLADVLALSSREYSQAPSRFKSPVSMVSSCFEGDTVALSNAD